MNVSTSFIITGLFVFALAGFLGFETIRRVPRLLHTPLMALTNALSAISLVGSLVVLGRDYSTYATILGLMHETNKHLVRKALLQPFIKYGVTLVSTGRTAVTP